MIHRFRFAVVALLLACWFVVPAAMGANLIQNPSFEPLLVSAGVGYIQIFSPSDPAGTLPNWNVTVSNASFPDGGIDLLGVGNPYLNGAAAEGQQYIDLDGSPGPGQINQSFAT